MPKRSTIGYPTRLKSRVSQEKLGEVERAFSLLKIAKYARAERESVWNDNVRRYKGKQWADDEDTTADRIVVNMTFSTITTMVPFVTGGDIKFLVEPQSRDSSKAKATAQKVYLNRLWSSRQVAGKKRIRQALTDSLIYGDGFIRVSYDVESIPSYDGAGRPIPNSESDVVRYSLDRVSPWDVFMDPDASDLLDARWYFVRYTRPVKEIQDDKRYYNTKGLEAETSNFDSEQNQVERNQYSEDANRLDDFMVLYDFYDADKRRMITITHQTDNPLRWIDEVEGTLVQFPNHEIPGSPWHMSEVEVVRDQQDELNKTRSQMITYRRRNAVKFLYRADVLSDEAVTALTSSIVNEGVPIDVDVPMEDIVSIIAPPEIQSDLYNLNELVRSEIFELTGVNEYLRGASPDIKRTATEATIIEGGTNVKTTDKLRAVEAGAEEIGQLLLDIAAETLPGTDYDELSEFVTGREAEQVLAAKTAEQPPPPTQIEGGPPLGAEGNAPLGGTQPIQPGVPAPAPPTTPFDDFGRPQDTEINIEPDLFVGIYKVLVERGSTELRNPQLKEQRFKEMFMTVSSTYPVLLQAQVQPDLRRFLELWLEAAGVDDIERMFLNQDQDPAVGQLLAQYDPQAGGDGFGVPPAEGAGNVPIAGRQQGVGQPKPESTGPPTDQIAPENSGILPPQ